MSCFLLGELTEQAEQKVWGEKVRPCVMSLCLLSVSVFAVNFSLWWHENLLYLNRVDFT